MTYADGVGELTAKLLKLGIATLEQINATQLLDAFKSPCMVTINCCIVNLYSAKISWTHT
jgi:hypothetical protein